MRERVPAGAVGCGVGRGVGVRTPRRDVRVVAVAEQVQRALADLPEQRRAGAGHAEAPQRRPAGGRLGRSEVRCDDTREQVAQPPEIAGRQHVEPAEALVAGEAEAAHLLASARQHRVATGRGIVARLEPLEPAAGLEACELGGEAVGARVGVAALDLGDRQRLEAELRVVVERERDAARGRALLDRGAGQAPQLEDRRVARRPDVAQRVRLGARHRVLARCRRGARSRTSARSPSRGSRP